MKAKLRFISISTQWLRRRSRPLVRAAVFVSVLAVVAVLLRATATTQRGSPDDLLRAALKRARAAGSYQVELDIEQTVFPEQANPIARGLSHNESAHFTVEGYVGSHQRARFAIRPQRTSQGLQLNAAARAQEILIADDILYEQDGDQWMKKDGLAPLPGINTDALSLLSVARDTHHLESVERLTGRYERVGFTLQSRDVLRLLLSQQGQVDEIRLALASASGLNFGGTGELWVDESGLPARLVLSLELNRPGDEGYRTVALSTADYSKFGARFASDLFDPTISPLTQVSTSPIPGSGLTAEQLSQAAAFSVALVTVLVLCWLLISGRSRAKTVVVSLAVIVALTSPYAAEVVRAIEPPAREGEARDAPAAAGGEVVQMLQEARAIAARHRQSPSNPASVPLQDTADEDGDGLPNGYELRLGTSPFLVDTDMDGLNDYREVVGFPCAEDPEIDVVETNPLLPDSNGDGLRDGDEFHNDQCREIRYSTSPDSWGEPIVSGEPYAWRDDNDGDGVPDGLDLSPFSASGELGGVGDYFKSNSAGNYYTEKVYYSNPGSNLSFETLDSVPGPGVAPYPFYVEMQVRTDERLMRAAFKKAIEWPKDTEGNIRNHGEGPDAHLISALIGEDLLSTGMVEVVPYLQATVAEADLPSLDAMQQYGITATRQIESCAADCDYAMVIPLVPVERNGRVFALQAKALHDFAWGDTNLHRSWRDIRLKWAVQGDIVRANDQGHYRPSPTDNYGLIVYDSSYTVTGVQFSRQGGTAMFVAAAEPSSTPELFDDGPIALLRAGMEAQFLTGRLSIDEIGARFDLGNSASITETWGITHTYRIAYGEDVRWPHLDIALLTTMRQITRDLLEFTYPAHDQTPTLILASEQRTSTINADDLDSADLADLTINGCLKPMVTTRSLKLQTYRYDPTASQPVSAAAAGSPASGDWVPLSLDEVLAKVASEFDQAFSDLQQLFDPTQEKYDTDELYNEALSILKMATTAWHIGQMAIQELGDMSVQDVAQALTDPEMLAWLLTESGLLPEGYAQAVYFLLGVIEAGGPIEWLEEQFSTVVEFVEGTVETFGGFLDSSPGLSAPSEETLLSFTHTAINVLNYLAVITGLSALATIAEVLTTLIEVYKYVKLLIDAVTTVVNTLQATGSAAQTVEALLNAALSEIRALGNSMSALGLLFGLGATWLSVAIVLGTNSLPPYVVSSLIARAVAETIILTIMFVIATVVPYGFILAIALALIRVLEEVFGVKLTPVSIFLDWFFGIEINPRSSVIDKRTGPVHFEPIDPQGGLVEEDRFRFWITSTVDIAGTRAALNSTWAGVEIGYRAGGGKFAFCTRDPDAFAKGLRYYDEYGWPLDYTPTREGFHCQDYKADVDVEVYDPRCLSSTDCQWVWKVMPGGSYRRGAAPYCPDPDLCAQTVHKYAYADFVPRLPRVNTWIPLDVSFHASTVNYVCSPYLDIADECYEYQAHNSSPPQFSKIWLDILPKTPFGFWEWNHMLNRDPDADGLEGYEDPATGRLVGPDTHLCLTPSHEDWDADDDGLSDKFEYGTPRVHACRKDSDSDGLDDGLELGRGTLPNDADSDDDGLRDAEETARWDMDTHALVAPWRIPLSGQYPGLPDPAAFPNPRHANLDGDHRNDKQERKWLTSPNGFNPIPDEPVELTVDPQLVQGGGTRIRITTSAWPNDGPAALDPELTVTLPVTFSDLTLGAGLLPLEPQPSYNTGTLQSPIGPYTYTWQLPPIWLNRYMTATLTGLPTIPTGPVTVTAQLVYTHIGTPHVVTDAVPLPVNLGGPTVTVDAPAAGAILPGGATTIAGLAQDPESASEVYVCAKTTPACSGADWTLASGASAWSTSWTPPVDDTYYVQGYAIDAYGVPGLASTPITVSVDGTPPSEAQFDLSGTAYLSTTFLSETLSTVRLTGRISDTPGGAYVSGAGDAVLLIDHGSGDPANGIRIQPTSEPGQVSSPFSFDWSLPYGGLGGVARSAAGMYTITLGATDLAGNAGPAFQTLNALIDDTPPRVYGRVPQIAAGTRLTLTGRADDTALVLPRLPDLPYRATMTLADNDSIIHGQSANSKVVVVGDVNGDTFDDVVLLEPADPSTSLRLGLFFGRPGGLPPTVYLDGADVVFEGEVMGSFATPPSVAGFLDLNGDGVGDLLVGDPNVGAGRVYVIRGRRGGGWPSPMALASVDRQLYPLLGTNEFGASVASAGDVDGDGLSDVLVGAAADAERAGIAYLYQGAEDAYLSRSAILRSPHCNTCVSPVAPNLAGLGDTNGDGLSDVLVAYSGSGTYASGVALIYGRSQKDWPASPVDLDTIAGALFNAPGDLQTVSPVGDVNADGLRDLLIGDPTANEARVFVLFGRRPEYAWPGPPAAVDLVSGADSSYIDIDPTGAPTRLGAGLAPMGDLDGDGRFDFAFGKPGGYGPIRTAIVRAVHMSPTLDMPVSAASFMVTGSSDWLPRSGEHLSSGDVNGDGVRDVLIGAPGEQRAYLLHGDYDPGDVSGVETVQVGLYGPVADPTLPYSETLPTGWRWATLDYPGGAVTPWTVILVTPADGEYRVYGRAYDRARNVRKPTSWYLGNVWVNTSPMTLTGESAAIHTPDLVSKTNLSLAGVVTSTHPIQALRVYDGYRWYRRMPTTGAWSHDSIIPRADLRMLTFRSVARDAYGNTLHVSRTLTTDTLALLPELSANLPVHQWHTDVTPTLVVTWPAVLDLSSIVSTWATIDTFTGTVPVTLTASNQVTRVLDQPGTYYGHVALRDGAGNSRVTHIGPFLVNRSKTPSVILPDGWLDVAGGEYPTGTLLNYDPYATVKPAALFGTWDSDRIYLGLPGNPWGQYERLSIYLDTTTGGLSSTLAPFGVSHTLPISADLALMLGADTLSVSGSYTLYQAGGAAWEAVDAPESLTITGFDTEIVLDRHEVGAENPDSPVRLLAYGEDPAGVWSVLPASGRPTTTATITGSVVFVDSLEWPAHGAGVRPDAGLDQIIAPVVQIDPGPDTALFSDTTTIMTVTVSNPDIGPYVDVPLTVTVGPTQPQQMMGIFNAAVGMGCIDCPLGGRQWTLLVDVEAYSTETVVLVPGTLVVTRTGVFSLPVTAGLANSGLAGDPQPPARAQYSLDQGVATVSFVSANPVEYVKPGQHSLDFVTGGRFLGCWQGVEADLGTGFSPACRLGDCFAITGTLPASSSTVWRLRVRSDNGRLSTEVTKTLVTDAGVTNVEITPVAVLSGQYVLIRGQAQVSFPSTGSLRRVEVSINGGRFFPAFVSRTDTSSGLRAATADVAWAFPLQLTNEDGERIRVVARAIDGAGNVSPNSDPVTVTLDTVGPAITITQNAVVLQGLVSDGSGVASVEVSLDGGTSYQTATLSAGIWTFNQASWSGPGVGFAIARARDVWDNLTHEAIVTSIPKTYLPVILRRR